MQQLKIKRRCKYRKGFTLTEVIVASMLLLFAMVPILKSMTQSTYASATIERKTQSLTIAQSKLNRIKATSIKNFDKNFAVPTTLISGSYYYKITQTSDSSDLKNITITVTHSKTAGSDIDTNPHRVTLATKIVRR